MALPIIVDSLAGGVYNITIKATDGIGNTVSDMVILAVSSLAITHPNNVSYFAGATGNNISWTATGLTTGIKSYIVLRNGTQVASNGTWTSGTPVTITIDSLTVGSYNYSIVAADGFGCTVQDTVIVTVQNVAPSVGHPVDVPYVLGTTGYTIAWNVTDASIGTTTYIVRRNGTENATGSWISGTPITINVSGLPVGSYNYTIIASDGLGGSVPL